MMSDSKEAASSRDQTQGVMTDVPLAGGDVQSCGRDQS